MASTVARRGKIVSFLHPMKELSERDPKDPRVVFAGHRERGPRRFTYTWTDMAALLGCSVKTAQNAASFGTFDPASLASVVAFRDARQASAHPKV